jgi:hypothetical protein
MKSAIWHLRRSLLGPLGSNVARHDAVEDERGSIEAGLTLIPVTLLFLILVQLVIAGSWQVVERAKLHDYSIKSNFSTERTRDSLTESQESSEIEGSGGTRKLTVTHRSAPGVGKITRYKLESEVFTFAPFFNWLGESVKLRTEVIEIE